MSRHLKALLASGDFHLGTWTQTAAPELIDLIGPNVFNFTITDCEHDVFGMETAENLAGLTDANDIASAARVPSNDPVMIMRALDAGIRHVVVLNLATADQAQPAVAATALARMDCAALVHAAALAVTSSAIGRSMTRRKSRAPPLNCL